MGTGFIILNLVLAVFVLTAILGLYGWGIRASSRTGIAAEAHRQSVGRGRKARAHPAGRQGSGSRRSGRAVAA
jgi:hypothetical protein